MSAMQIPYTYWKSGDGRVGYWNDYPDYSTQGKTLAELRFMLKDLREGIKVMLAAGDIPASSCRTGVMELA